MYDDVSSFAPYSNIFGELIVVAELKLKFAYTYSYIHKLTYVLSIKSNLAKLKKKYIAEEYRAAIARRSQSPAREL